LARFTRAPPVRDTRAFRAQAGPPSSDARRKPWAVSSRSPLWGANPPSPTRAGRSHPPDAAGTCQAGARGDAASPGGPAGPASHADRTPPAARPRRGRNRFRPFARDALVPSTPMGQAPRAGRGQASQAPGPQVRPPQTGTHRLPPARAPWAPAIRVGRKVRAVSHGGRGWGQNGRFFWGAGAKWQRRTGSGHRRHRKQMTGMGPGGDWWVSEWPGGKAVIDLHCVR
jgi:hypothetical protein